MSEGRAKNLEEKYWQGETTLEEEKELRRLASERPDSMSPYLAELMSSTKEEIDQTAEKSLDQSFDDKFWSAAENDKTKIRRLNFTSSNFVRMAAAAVVVLALGFGLWYGLEEDRHRTTSVEIAEDTFENPEKAFEEARQALMFASAKLNQGAAPVKKIKKFHQAKLSVAGAASTEKDTIGNHESNK